MELLKSLPTTEPLVCCCLLCDYATFLNDIAVGLLVRLCLKFGYILHVKYTVWLSIRAVCRVYQSCSLVLRFSTMHL